MAERPFSVQSTDLRQNARQRRGSAVCSRSRDHDRPAQIDPKQSLVAGDREGEKYPIPAVRDTRRDGSLGGELILNVDLPAKNSELARYVNETHAHNE